jgi:hypothetical protein
MIIPIHEAHLDTILIQCHACLNLLVLFDYVCMVCLCCVISVL